MKQRSNIPLLPVPLEPDSVIPLYQQIDQAIRQAIHTRRLEALQTLPSTRALALEWQVSRHTVLEAFDQLLAEGYLESLPRSQIRVAEQVPKITFVPHRTAQHTPSQRQLRLNLPQAAVYPAPETWAFAVGVPALREFPQRIWQRLVHQNSQKRNVLQLHYQALAGFLPLRQSIANYLHQARGLNCQPEQIIMTNGSQQAIHLAAHVLLEAGEAVWLENPGYLGARFALLQAALQVIPVPLDSEGFDLKAALQRTSNAKLAYVTPSNQFPMGITMSLPRRLALLQWAEQNRTWILEDDYDFEYRYNTKPLAALASLDTTGRVLYLGTFSKVLFPALRLGYIVVPPSLIHAFEATLFAHSGHVPIFEQMVTNDFIENGHFARHIRRMRHLYAEQQNLLLQAATNSPLQLEPNQAGMQMLLRLKNQQQAQKVYDQARNAGLLLESLASFCLEPIAESGVLLGYAAPNATEIKAGLQLLSKILSQQTNQ
jgi:GntR family transcriptional regulator / MocR family aminotransferase